jgi:hypothetical protein
MFATRHSDIRNYLVPEEKWLGVVVRNRLKGTKRSSEGRFYVRRANLSIVPRFVARNFALRVGS